MPDDFYGRFRNCMEANNMPVPQAAFGEAQVALATVKALADGVKQFGPSVTVAEIAIAASLPEQLAAATAVMAAAYLGFCIGCLIQAGLNINDLVAAGIDPSLGTA